MPTQWADLGFVYDSNPCESGQILSSRQTILQHAWGAQ